MAEGDSALMQSARERAYATPLDQFHVADVSHFTSDTWAPWFERLRREDPVHYCANSEFGPYWSVTRFHDIVAVDSNNEAFSSSSERGGIAIQDGYQPHELSSFIALDPPDHDAQRRVVMPMFSTAGMAELEPLIRSRAAAILDELPVGETFDFTDRIVGLTRKESDAILGMLFEHIQKPEFLVRWRWSENAIAFWDNRVTQHYAVNDYLPARRVMVRATILCDRPYHRSRRGAEALAAE
jgi:cytochrome P450